MSRRGWRQLGCLNLGLAVFNVWWVAHGVGWFTYISLLSVLVSTVAGIVCFTHAHDDS